METLSEEKSFKIEILRRTYFFFFFLNRHTYKNVTYLIISFNESSLAESENRKKDINILENVRQ